VALITAIVAILLFANARTQEQEAQRRADIAQAQALAARARNLLGNNAQQAMLVALAAQEIAQTQDAVQVISEIPYILWDAATRQPLPALKGHTGSVMSIVFSPDSRQLASGSADETIILWNVTTGQPLSTFKGHTGSVFSLAFSPDSSRLASGSLNGETILWNVATGQLLSTFMRYSSGVKSVVFNPDGSQLAWGSGDNIIIWDMAADQPLSTLRGHTGSVSSVAFSPDGRYLASGSNDRSIRILDAKFAQPPCQWLTRNLSRQEWRQFVSPDLPYRKICPGLPIPAE